MKLTNLITNFFFLIWVSSPLFSQPVALIVAVSDYPKDSQWPSLSASNDAKIIQKTLTRHGFDPENILIIQDEQATREGILHVLENEFLSRVQTDGIALFHFSGHGQQVWDDNGDEIDGYDEAIVPFDSPKYYQEGAYEGEKLIRDEELGAALLEVRKKLGPKGQLLTLIDACHSGTATRGYGRTRGTHIPMASPEYIGRFPVGVKEKAGFLKETINSMHVAPMVAIFSSGAYQLSYEYVDPLGNGHGVLSYAFCKTMEGGIPAFSYRELFDRIQSEISLASPRQTPQAEGDLDLPIFNGKAPAKVEYFTVREWIDRRTVRLDVGILGGLFDNSVLAFYPFAATDTNLMEPIAVGTVEYATPWDCNLRLDRPLEMIAALNSKLFVVERNFGALSATVKLDLPAYNTVARELLNNLRVFGAIRLVEEDPELILTSHPEKGVQLVSREDYVLWEQSLAGRENLHALAKELEGHILEFAQGKFLRSLEIEEAGIVVDIQFLDLQHNPLPREERQVFHTGEQALVQITNRGNTPFYFTLIDLQPDNHFNLLIPWAGALSSDYVLNPGASYVFEEPLKASPPFGTEMLKCIATLQPLNLSTVVKNRGEKKESWNPPHPLEVLLSETYFPDEKTRGGITSNYLGGGATVKTIVFEIAE